MIVAEEDRPDLDRAKRGQACPRIAMSAIEVSALMEERAKVEIEVTAVVPQAL